MSYEKIRNKTIPKYLFGSNLTVLEGTFEERMKKKQLRQQKIQQLGIDPEDAELFSDEELNAAILGNNTSSPTLNLLQGVDFGSSEADKKNIAALQKNINLNPEAVESESGEVGNGAAAAGKAGLDILKQGVNMVGALGGAGGENGANAFNTGINVALEGNGKVAAAGVIGGAITTAVNVVDNATMGDKNFSASSQAIDQAVHGVSGALMLSGNPYAMAAGAALEGLNFATKAGGKNVQGFDVNINSSGYGDLGHKGSEAGRVWDTWSGSTARKLAKRNEQARMALAAADIAGDVKYEQEARANSVDNVLRQNSIALAGGIDTSLLAN